MYWGFQGAEDYAQYVTDNNSPNAKSPGYSDPYGASMFFNLGLQYKPFENIRVRVDGYNLMGLFDKTLNKQLYGFNSFADYRSQVPVVAISMTYKF
jgi:hypothetical protein